MERRPCEQSGQTARTWGGRERKRVELWWRAFKSPYSSGLLPHLSQPLVPPEQRWCHISWAHCLLPFFPPQSLDFFFFLRTVLCSQQRYEEGTKISFRNSSLSSCVCAASPTTTSSSSVSSSVLVHGDHLRFMQFYMF